MAYNPFFGVSVGPTGTRADAVAAQAAKAASGGGTTYYPTAAAAQAAGINVSAAQQASLASGAATQASVNANNAAAWSPTSVTGKAALASLAAQGISQADAIANTPYTQDQMNQFYGVGTPAASKFIEPGGANQQPDPNNPWAGIPSSVSGQLRTEAEAQAYWTGGQTNAQPVANQKATLTSPNGEKKVVTVGSQEASQLLSTGWTLGDKVGGGTVDSNLLGNVPDINIGDGTQRTGSSEADTSIAGSKTYVEQTRKEQAQAEVEAQRREKDEQDLIADKLLADITDLTANAKSQETIKLEERAKADIQAKENAVRRKADEIDIMLAKDAALTASYNTANQTEEGRPQTLSQLRGSQAQNYKMYLAQHNQIAADTALLVAQGKSLQGDLNGAIASANEAISLRYNSQQDAINNKINMLNILMPQIDKKDKEYATAMKNIYDRENDALDERKSWMATAVNAGIFDAGVLKQIEIAGGFAEAMGIIGQNRVATGGVGGGGYESGYNIPEFQPISFEEFIQRKQDEAGMTFADPELYRSEYDTLIKQSIESQETQGTDIIGAYALAMNQGQASLSSIPNDIRNEVVLRNAQIGGINTKLSETAIKQIAETQNALDGLLDLQDKIAGNLEYIGPIKGLQKLNPFSKARQIQADVDRIRQKVGKALEGGVLRKEDEEKYKKILATLTDTPETARYKIEQLITDIQTDYERYVEAQASAGRYIGGFDQQSITNNDPLGIL